MEKILCDGRFECVYMEKRVYFKVRRRPEDWHSPDDRFVKLSRLIDLRLNVLWHDNGHPRNMPMYRLGLVVESEYPGMVSVFYQGANKFVVSFAIKDEGGPRLHTGHFFVTMRRLTGVDIMARAVEGM